MERSGVPPHQDREQGAGRAAHERRSGSFRRLRRTGRTASSSNIGGRPGGWPPGARRWTPSAIQDQSLQQTASHKPTEPATDHPKLRQGPTGGRRRRVAPRPSGPEGSPRHEGTPRVPGREPQDGPGPEGAPTPTGARPPDPQVRKMGCVRSTDKMSRAGPRVTRSYTIASVQPPAHRFASMRPRRSAIASGFVAFPNWGVRRYTSQPWSKMASDKASRRRPAAWRSGPATWAHKVASSKPRSPTQGPLCLWQPTRPSPRCRT